MNSVREKVKFLSGYFRPRWLVGIAARLFLLFALFGSLGAGLYFYVKHGWCCWRQVRVEELRSVFGCPPSLNLLNRCWSIY